MEKLDPVSKILFNLNATQNEIKRHVLLTVIFDSPDAKEILNDLQIRFEHMKDISSTTINYLVRESRFNGRF